MSDEFMDREELEAHLHESRKRASEQNTGAPCDVCGAKQPRFAIQTRPDGGVFVGISYEIPAGKAQRELAAIRQLLKGFEDGAPPAAKKARRT